MPYSGADVLAHLSELARQRAALPRISRILIISQDQAEGDLIQSVLRAVVGYDTHIAIAGAASDVRISPKNPAPQAVFWVDTGRTTSPAEIAKTLSALRSAGIVCPIAVIRDKVTHQCKAQHYDLGAADVLSRDEVCGLRLRECLLRLLAV